MISVARSADPAVASDDAPASRPRRAANVRRRIVAPLAALALAFAAMAPAPASAQGAEFSSTTELELEVMIHDPAAGVTVVQDLTDGEFRFFTADHGLPADFPLAAGDRLSGRSTIGITAGPAEPGDAPRTRTGRIASVGESEGRPALVTGLLVSTRMRFETWDPETGQVVGVAEDGGRVAYLIQSEEGRAFLSQVPPGTPVEIEISETLQLTRVSP